MIRLSLKTMLSYSRPIFWISFCSIVCSKLVFQKKIVFHLFEINMCVSSSLKENMCFIVSKPLCLTLCHPERRRSEPVDNTAVPNLLHFNLAQYFSFELVSVFLVDYFLNVLHFNVSQYFYISTWFIISFKLISKFHTF